MQDKKGKEKAGEGQRSKGDEDGGVGEEKERRGRDEEDGGVGEDRKGGEERRRGVLRDGA